ncbi:transposase [Psychrobacillus sp. OK032]|uniref:transposase n=1 Tax=Psychrobacillus sp. OK032 TaxID=1884358 RepID=UPI0008C91124|nr:transposase [Psychrobacillus sp. OK032]SES17763.1 hypothetical protein SAMN05518872_105121 [Psychrobacillus sp. OK032]
MSVKYDNDFKEKVAKEAISINNITATAKKYGVNSNSVRKWKNDLEKKLGVGEIQKTIGLETEKDVSLFKREILELKTRLEVTLKDLNEAMTLIGEKDLYIKKLERSINK